MTECKEPWVVLSYKAQHLPAFCRMGIHLPAQPSPEGTKYRPPTAALIFCCDTAQTRCWPESVGEWLISG
jgi:hypothetical protein